MICEMHDCLRRPMLLCRWAGLFPVEGLHSKNSKKLRFNLRCSYTLYYYSTLICQLILVCLCVCNFIMNEISLENLINVLFYLTGLTSALLLWKLSREWPKLIRKAESIEDSITIIRLKNDPKRYNIIVCVIMLSSLLEHIFSVMFNTKFVVSCSGESRPDILVRLYFVKMIQFISNFTSYSLWKAVLYFISNLQATFLWNFTDAMTICFSVYLTKYFRDLNNFIEKNKDKIICWEEVRICYSKLVELTREVDSRMSYLILLSFFTNLFFVCIQLFCLVDRNYPKISECEEKQVKLIYDSVEHSMYYSFSFLLILTRATMTSLLAANINTVACKPIHILQCLPQSDYTLEVQRFIRQLRYMTTALSGQFFYITRETILAVIATLVKYELVLLQFNPRS